MSGVGHGIPAHRSGISEKTVKAKVKTLLKKYKCYQFWPVQTGYGAATLDCLGCHRGRFFSVETKAPGKNTTARQELTMAVMNEAKAAVFVVGEEYYLPEKVFSGMEELEAWLLLVR